jgi:hypothetical protein
LCTKEKNGKGEEEQRSHTLKATAISAGRAGDGEGVSPRQRPASVPLAAVKRETGANSHEPAVGTPNGSPHTLPSMSAATAMEAAAIMEVESDHLNLTVATR